MSRESDTSNWVGTSGNHVLVRLRYSLRTKLANTVSNVRVRRVIDFYTIYLHILFFTEMFHKKEIQFW